MIDSTAHLSIDQLNQKIKQEEIKMEVIKDMHNHTGTDLIDHLRASYGVNANGSPLIRDMKNITESETTF